MINFYKLLFFFTLLLGILIAISSYSWLSMWIGLEINLLSIIPLLKDSKNMYPSESALKYFITQALASSILLFSIILSLNLNEYSLNYPIHFIFDSALLTKLGAAPFHMWFPEVIEGLNWMTSLVMLTVQKIAPMILLFYSMKSYLLLILVIIMSSLIGGLLGLNQVSLRKIMAYSSINHISWMLASMLNFQLIWSIYFFIYSIITLNIILMFNQMNIYYVNQFNIIMNYNKITKIFFALNFMSLGGLPPFLGFLPKWLVINNLTQSSFFFLSTILIILTLITLFFYLRIIFSVLLMNTNEILLKSTLSLNFWIMIFNFLSIFGLLSCTMIFNFI